MLKTILAISGKPGLYKLISQAKNMLIVESVADKKRMPIYASDKVISLGDIAMYTDAEEVPLAEVLESVKTKENGQAASLDFRKASAEELHAFMAEVLPNYDRDRVHTSGMICWLLAVKQSLLKNRLSANNLNLKISKIKKEPRKVPFFYASIRKCSLFFFAQCCDTYTVPVSF